jgi:branched-chain amino acid transport system permease protein
MKRYLWLLLLLVVLVSLPLLIQNRYLQHLFVISGIFVLFCLGLNLIVGFLGQLSLGHSAYFGIGAYTYGLVSLNTGMPFGIALIAAIIVTAIFGFLIGYPSLRLRGPYFAIVSLGFAMIIRLIVNNWEGLTHGPMGLTGIQPPSLGFAAARGAALTTARGNYYLVLFFCLLGVLLIRRLKTSRVGDTFAACRENEELAQAVGVNVARFKIIAFIISTTFIGASGSLYSAYVGYVSPEIFGWYYIATPLIMVLIGGAGTVVGPIMGAVLFTFLPELLRGIADYRLAIFGLLMTVGVIFMPDGIYGMYQRVVGRE